MRRREVFMKKLIAMAMSALMALSLTGAAFADETEAAGADLSGIKAGFIFLHDENSTYDLNFINGAKQAAEDLGLSEDQIILKTNIPEGQECYETAADLADQGCNIIFADSFGHEDYMIQAAQEFPDVEFCHSTGTKAHTEDLPNYHNAFASIYEGRYLAGVAAGMKLNEMIENGEFTEEEAKIGYVGAFTYAEVISGFTSFFLGARSVCPTATMEVQYTNSWFDIAKEGETAKKLIADNCVLISQHADSTGAPAACEEEGVPCVGYNIDMIPTAPNTALTSPTNNWGPYYTYAVQSVIDGTPIDTDWSQGLADGSCLITALNEATIAEGTAEKVAEVEEAIKSGSLHVFDTSTFTVGGSSLEDYIAAHADEFAEGGAYQFMDTHVADGYFHESEPTSAPAFAMIIDGITSVTQEN
jgi:basic membrane protein A